MASKQSVLVTGSRDYTKKGVLEALLTGLLSKWLFGEFTLIHGGALGADKLAKQWAAPLLENVEATVKGNVHKWNGVINMIQVDAEWDKYGKGAGARRNAQMLEYEPKLCIAFKDNFDHTFEHGGTENMCVLAMTSGIPTYLIEKLELPA